MTACAIWTVSSGLADERRRELVYGGDLLVFKGVEPMRRLCSVTHRILRESFGAPEPPRAQFELERDDYLDRVEAIQRVYREHPEARKLFLAVLEEVGVDPGHTFWDWLYLRVLPHGEEYTGRRTSGLGFHRDTWASNVYAQTNWWAPIYPITSRSTIAFYPEYWHRPLKNTSVGWDLEEVRAGKKAALVPEPAEPVSTVCELRPVIEPGDILCFSGAHLHASVPNTSGLTRFSIEVRTVDARDMLEGRGAPNVDGQAPRSALGWFRSVADGTPLPEVLGYAPEE